MKDLTLKSGKDTVASYGIPENWTENPEKKRLQAMSTALGYPYPHNWKQIVKDYVGLTESQLSLIPSVQLWDLFDALHWMISEPTTEAVVQTFRHKKITYSLPNDKLWNASGIEYAIADEYYTKFADDQDPQYLTLLLATLAREHDKNKPRHKYLEDPRVPLYNREECEERAEKLKNIDPVYQQIALLQFTGSKKWIYDHYGQYIFDTGGDGEKDPFGWWGVFMRLAETGVFGNLDDTVQHTIHEICQYLMKNSMDAERMKRKSKSKSRS